MSADRESLFARLWRWLTRRRRDERVAGWPNATLYCVRHQDHPPMTVPAEGYPVGYPNLFGPPRTEPRCVECGALMYVAAIEVPASAARSCPVPDGGET